MNANLCEELPYWEFETAPFAHFILSDGSVSSAVEILPLDIECFDAERVNQLTQSLRTFVNSLPEAMTAQFLMRVETDFTDLLSKHKSLVTTKTEFLSCLDSARTSALSSQIEREELFRPRLFLFLKTEAPRQRKTFSLSNSQKFSQGLEKEFEERLQTLSQSLDGAESLLSGIGFAISRPNKDDLIKLLYRYLNPRRASQVVAPGVAIRPTAVEGDSPRAQIVFSDLVLDQEDFVLDSQRTRVISLKTLPEMTFAGMMSGFLNLPFRYDLIFSFHIPDQAKEMRGLEQKRRMAHSLASGTSARVSDLESESRLSQTTDLIREIIESGQRIFQAELQIILREPNTDTGKRRLSLNTKEVLSRFRTLSGSEGMQETVGSWPIFKSELPGAPLKLIRTKKMKTNNLVDFLPLYGASRGDDLPVVLTHTRSGSLYSYNPRDQRLGNYNMLATGSSGSGKSFANNCLMLQRIARGAQVFIIDIGGSYRKLTQCLGGQYFEINLSEKYSINPFELRDSLVAVSGEKIKGLVSIVEQMVVDEGEKLTRFDRVQLEEAITKVFAQVREREGTRSPLISDLVRHCEKSHEPSLQRIGKLLFPWTGDSPYGKLLDRPGKIKADSPIVAFDLKGLSQFKDLQTVVTLVLTSLILDQVENDRTRDKEVLLDEAWEQLKSPAASSFMEYAARTFRKTGSGIGFITQGVEEIVSSAIGPAILNNTAIKLVMLQKGDVRVLAQALKLNQQEVRLIQSLEQRKGVFSEGFLMAGETRQVIRFMPTPLEYWVSTSDARDNQLIDALTLKNHSLESALHQLATELPFGSNGPRGQLRAVAA